MKNFPPTQWVALCVVLLTITLTPGCNKKQAPPVEADASVSFILKGNQFQGKPNIEYELTQEQAQSLVELISQPPDTIYAKGEGIFISLNPMHCFVVDDVEYKILNNAVFYQDSEQNKFVWHHPFIQAIHDRSGLNNQDELSAFFETMSDYDWPQ